MSVPGAMSQLWVSCATVSGSVPPRIRLRAEMLTAIVRSNPASHHSRCWCRASSSTHVVSGSISSLRAASGMKSAGISSPAVGCRQRTSASTPVVRRVARSIFGW